MKNNVNFLLVDDDDVDIIGMKRLFKKHDFCNPTFIAKDGIEALAILNGENGYDAIRKPYLIFLDINMPRMNGIEFLEQLRNNPKHKNAIVFVLTTSQYIEDRINAYSYNVAGYINKSSFGYDTEQFINIIKSYLKIVDFPE